MVSHKLLYVTFANSVVDVLFAVSYGAAFVALLTKFLEWSAMWNMSIVISTLEGLYGLKHLRFLLILANVLGGVGCF